MAARRVHHVAPGDGPCIRYTGQVIHVKLGAEQSGGEMTVIEDVIDPQAGPPLHVHERENEAYYVLEGEFEFACGNDTIRGGPGTFVHAPRGVPHRYSNVGSTPGKMLFAFTPGGIEAFFADMGNEKELTRERVIAIAAKHGITVV
jgi:quercetin dioxygenase-like cupin family protein